MKRSLPTLIVSTLLTALAGVSPAGAATGPAHGFVPHQLIVKFAGERLGRVVALPSRVAAPQAALALRKSPRVDYAQPNYVATASAFMPDDPGKLAVTPGSADDWVHWQWNFLPWQPGTVGVPTSPGGIDAVNAWRNLIAAGRPGAEGVTVAVLDTGIAYRNLGWLRATREPHFRRSPDFSAGQFVPGYNFVNGNRLPVDTNGHGTHVAGTIAEATNNGIGLTGLAYKAKLMPVQVLNSQGRGRASNIAAGIRFAVNHGAQVVNMSFNFGCGRGVPAVAEALRYAAHKGVVAVASVGNLGSESCVSAPANEPGVIGVGGTTEGGCLGQYSLTGAGVDVLAPGGGVPVPGCPSVLSAPIYQVTLKSPGSRSFGTPGDYVGTSMAAAHVSGVAAMILASGLIDTSRLPASIPIQVEARLEQTARSIGLPPTEQGAGLIDAASATDPSIR